MESALRHPETDRGQQLEVEGELQLVSELLAWRYVCSCCGGRCNVAYFPAIRKYFVNQWECLPLYPGGVISGLFLSFFFAIFSLHAGARQLALPVLTSFTFSLWLISSVCAVLSSPGYIPFYWSVGRGECFTYQQQMSGVITTTE
jgi:hypothetical protein